MTLKGIGWKPSLPVGEIRDFGGPEKVSLCKQDFAVVRVLFASVGILEEAGAKFIAKPERSESIDSVTRRSRADECIGVSDLLPLRKMGRSWSKMALEVRVRIEEKWSSWQTRGRKRA